VINRESGADSPGVSAPDVLLIMEGGSVGGTAGWCGTGEGWHSRGVLRELRGRDGSPHAGTRLVALVIALLLAAPLTVFVWRAVTALLDALL